MCYSCAMSFIDSLKSSIKLNNSLLCVGLDPDMDKLPNHLKNSPKAFFEFNKAIVDSTHDLVCCFKPQYAFYAAAGLDSLAALKQTIDYIHTTYPQIPVILDAKRGDIGSTAEKYTEEVFKWFQVDAVTVNPYLGKDSVEPFLKYTDKGIIILCRTSNKGASDIQNLKVEGEPLYLKVAQKIIDWNKDYGNCLMVVGATWPEELKQIRELAADMFFLVPGIGAQGGDLEKTLQYGLTKNKSGLIISASRSILYASKEQDFAQKAAEEAKKLRDQINNYR